MKNTVTVTAFLMLALPALAQTSAPPVFRNPLGELTVPEERPGNE